MADLQTRITQYVQNVSGVTDWTIVDEWLTVGAQIVIDRLPEDEAAVFASAISVPDSTGVSMANRRLVSAYKGDIGCRIVPQEMYGQIADTTSILAATTLVPVATVRNGNLYVFPGGGNASVINYISVVHSDENISLFKQTYEDVVVLFAAVRLKIHLVQAWLETSLTALPDITTAFGTIDLVSRFAHLVSLLDTEEDIELAHGVIAEIQTRIAEFQAENTDNKDLQRYSLLLNTLFQQFAAYLQEIQLLRSLYQEALMLAFGGQPSESDKQ